MYKCTENLVKEISTFISKILYETNVPHYVYNTMQNVTLFQTDTKFILVVEYFNAIQKVEKKVKKINILQLQQSVYICRVVADVRNISTVF